MSYYDFLRSARDNCGFGLIANIKNIASHKNLESAITALERMMHRGAIAADGKTGDGSGLLLSMPQEFMVQKAHEMGVELPKMFAVASLFTPKQEYLDVVASFCEKNDLKVVLNREVPVDKRALGEQALASLPTIVHVYITPNSLMATQRFDALLYLARKEIEHILEEDKAFYISSMSSQTISYKGLVMPTHIKEFYTDLQDESFKNLICAVSSTIFYQYATAMEAGATLSFHCT